MGGMKGEPKLVNIPDIPEVKLKPPLLKLNSKGLNVMELQTLLNHFDYRLTVDGDYGPVTELAVRDFQSKHGLRVDGIAGPKTFEALKAEPLPKVVTPSYKDVPWMTWMEQRIGMNESDNDKELAECWKYTTYTPGQKAQTVRGRDFAWCAAIVCQALEVNGYKSTKSAAASSYRAYGTPCEFKYGAIISMRHATGSNHVTFFAGWADEAKKIAKCLGGNQSNSIKVSHYNLSGNKNDHDEVMGGPRWPIKK